MNFQALSGAGPVLGREVLSGLIGTGRAREPDPTDGRPRLAPLHCSEAGSVADSARRCSCDSSPEPRLCGERAKRVAGAALERLTESHKLCFWINHSS